MKYLHWVIWGLECLAPALHAVTINTTSVPDFPQPPVPPLIERSSPDTSEVDITPTPKSQPGVHTVYPIFVDNPPEYEESETVAFPPDSSNRAAAESAVAGASITLACNPAEYGTPVTTTERVPVVAIIAVFDPPFPVKTGRTREDIQTTYAMGWLAPDPDKDQNNQTIEASMSIMIVFGMTSKITFTGKFLVPEISQNGSICLSMQSGWGCSFN